MMRDEHGPPRARAGPPDDRLLLPPRPGPRPGPGAHRDARRRHRARRHPAPTPATPTATPEPGPSRSGSPARSWSRTCTPPTADPAAPTTAPSSPTAPLLPGHAQHTAGTRPARPRRDPGQTAAHDQQTAEIARYKLGKITTDDHDGYHRVMCPAAMGKIRCPLRPASMRLDRADREILTPPGHPPACCTQQTITVPPQTCAKTAQEARLPVQGAPASPTPGAPAPSEPSPPPRTPPATTSPAAGPGSRA